MAAIFRRELSAYFSSATAYIYLAVFNFFAALFFSMNNLYSATTDMSGLFANMFMIFLFLIPILTMRLMSEDKKQKTDQCLLTSPVSLYGIVLGKYLAALVMFAVSLLTFLLYAVILAAFSAVAWPAIIGSIVGVLLTGSAFIAVGLFISSLTESQVIAAIGGFLAMMLLYTIDMLASFISNTTIQNLLNSLAFYSKYYEFTTGVFNFSSILFFISSAVIFLFLTVRVLEKKRWS